MRTITAKFNSVCAESGAKIKKGEQCIYDPYLKKVYALTSLKAISFLNSEDPALGAIQANEEAYFDNFCQRNNI